MNSDQLLQLAQKGFRVTLGATATLLETLQDPQRREESFSRFRSEFGQLTEEWAVKGETTEQEARSFVDELLRQRSTQSDASSAVSSNLPTPTSTSSTTGTATPEIQQDLQDLTAQLAAIRAELEKLRAQDS